MKMRLIVDIVTRAISAERGLRKYLGVSETYERLKEINQKIKVLLSSGYSIDGQAKETMKRGCDGFIQKPFSLEQLSQNIRKVLDQK